MTAVTSMRTVLSPRRMELLEIIRRQGYLRLDQPVHLASGAMSSDFIDAKKALAQWRDLRLACEAIHETVSAAGHSYNAVGGLTMGADALAVGVAAVADCAWFMVRKEPKKRGTNQLIEGSQISDGDKVLLVDDVITTGRSIFVALDVVCATGADVVAAVTLVDRGDNAAAEFARRGVDYYPMLTYSDFGIDRVDPPVDNPVDPPAM